MKKITKILEILENKYGNEELTELDYINEYTLLVAVMLSAQATDRGVNLATKELFKIVKTPKEMVTLGVENLERYIKTINYYHTKAKNIISMSEKLVKDYNSKLPNTMEGLTGLAGVGRKTANIILNIVFNKPAIAVDTHVFRVSNRLGITKAKNVLESEQQLIKATPKKYIKNLNNNLVMFGRYECKAVKPHCNDCVLSNYCDYFKNKNK